MKHGKVQKKGPFTQKFTSLLIKHISLKYSKNISTQITNKM